MSSSPPTRRSAEWGALTRAPRCLARSPSLWRSGPTELEYGTTVGGGPIVGYGDQLCVYDKDMADRLMKIATDRGLSPQPAALGAFESDASHAKATGLTPRAGLLCLPTLSTHGFEVIRRAAVDEMAGVVADFLLNT